MVLDLADIVHAQSTLVTNVDQPYTWYDDHGQQAIDLPDWLDDDDDESTSLFEFLTISAGFFAGGTVGTAYGGFGGFALGAFISKEVGEEVAELTPELIETVATDINDFLGVVEDTYDTHTIPFGIWNGTLAQEFTTGSNSHGYDLSADLNGDGLVDIVDLVLVAGAFSEEAASPSLHSQVLELLIAAEVRQWLLQAQQLNLTDATTLRGILFLEQLLAMLLPKETALLPNYPNPFNPETWIPYQLAHDAFVTLTIYDGSGQVIRTLDVGHRVASFYESRSEAIYWDGRNEFGEQVSSGIYFYTLTAADYSATRKMLILK